MKKFLVWIMVAAMLCAQCITAFAVEVNDVVEAQIKKNQETDPDVRATNVHFGDGYYGFCLDRTLEPAHDGDQFKVLKADGNIQTNQTTEEGNPLLAIANQIKLLVVENFNELFADGNSFFNPYDNDSDGIITMLSKYAGDFQSAVWYLTDGEAPTQNGQKMIDNANSADSLRVIPDHGYIRTYSARNNPYYNEKYTVTVTFDFYVLSPISEDEHGERQQFIMFKVTPLATVEGENPIFPNGTPTDSPDVSPTPTPVAPTPTPTVKPENNPTPTPTVKPENDPTPTPSVKPENDPTPTPTVKPTWFPSTPTPKPVLPPKTGDEAPLILWMALMGISAAGIAFICAKKKQA